MYKGQVSNVQYSVNYWKYKETEEEGEVVTMTLIDFLVHYIIGDLQINEPASF